MMRVTDDFSRRLFLIRLAFLLIGLTFLARPRSPVPLLHLYLVYLQHAVMINLSVAAR